MASSTLFQELLYQKYKGDTGIFGNTDFWDSERGGKYSDKYSILSRTNATELFIKSKQLQSHILKTLVRGKYAQQFHNANTFIKNIYRPISLIEGQRKEFLNGNEIFKKINEFFNMPLKHGGNQGYSQVTTAENNLAAQVENMFLQMGVSQSAKGSIQRDLIMRLNNLLLAANNFEDQSAQYASLKGREVEKVISDYLNRMGWAKNIQTGNIFKNNIQLGEDIMIMGHLTEELEELANKINNTQISITIDDSVYSALKATEQFSIQVKSGVNQSIFNKTNSLYQISLQELSKFKQLTMLQQLREWDQTQSMIGGTKGQKTEGNRYKNLNKSKTRQAGYLKLWPESETLRAIATYALSKSTNVLQSLYRLHEYQVYWILPYGFITLPEYLEKTQYYWQFSNTKIGFDFTPTFMVSRRQVTLRKTT